MAIYTEEERAPVSLPVVRDRLLLCVRKNFHRRCAQALEAFLAPGPDRWRVVMVDWLPEEQARRASLLWVVDTKVELPDVLVRLRNQLPLLVPEENPELKSLCSYGECGLYYRDAADAAACLSHLGRDNELRRTLGRNGFRLFYGPRLGQAGC